ncbi:hypothetical protein L9F63_008371, partial [Diploptera punctata]
NPTVYNKLTLRWHRKCWITWQRHLATSRRQALHRPVQTLHKHIPRHLRIMVCFVFPFYF